MRLMPKGGASLCVGDGRVHSGDRMVRRPLRARRIFVSALAVFTLGSALRGLVQNFEVLVAMRVL
jgi:MFS family permease